MEAAKPLAYGRIRRVVGLTLEARGINIALGGRARVHANAGTAGTVSSFETEVVGFDGASTFLMPLRPIAAIKPGARVEPLHSSDTVPVGDSLLGRVVDGCGQPIDNAGPLANCDWVDLHPPLINPLDRNPIAQALDVGIRSINGSLTVGCGQRVGLFAGSGVGKSVLLGMLTRFTQADVVVVALVGERGREVREFVETNLGDAGMRKTVVVAAPADETPVMRLRSGLYAARLSEYYRDRGQRVLLLFDSLTRYAQAQREIALATGEPPATRGYPPSVFARLPQLVERAGNGGQGSGSVTAFYTVLTEGDDLDDPIADASRAILDGHIVLSRALANEGVYPAIDIQASISRSMTAVAGQDHLQAALAVKQLNARYQASRDLISVGAYTAGSDPLTDQAIACQPALQAYLQQGLGEPVTIAASVGALQQILQSRPAEAPQGDAPAGAGVVSEQ